MGADHGPLQGIRSRERVVAVSTAGAQPWTTALRELWADRELTAAFAARTLKASYKQTFFGFGWAVVRPLVMLVVFIVFFGRVAGFEDDTTSYAAFALSALVGWQLLAAVVGGATYSLVNEATLLRKVYFPRLAPVLGRALANMVQMGVGVATLLVMAPLVDATFSLQLLWLPLLLALILLPALAVGIALAGLSVWFRDFATLSGFLLQVWLFASPVAYPATKIDQLELYSLLNPMVGPLEGMRRVYVDGIAPDAELLVLSGATSLVLAIVALELFRRLEPGFADVI